MIAFIDISQFHKLISSFSYVQQDCNKKYDSSTILKFLRQLSATKKYSPKQEGQRWRWCRSTPRCFVHWCSRSSSYSHQPGSIKWYKGIMCFPFIFPQLICNFANSIHQAVAGVRRDHHGSSREHLRHCCYSNQYFPAHNTSTNIFLLITIINNYCGFRSNWILLYFPTVRVSVCPSVRVSQAWHLTFLTYIKA